MGTLQSVVISLVTAVETFVNLLIPHDYIYKTTDKNGSPVDFDKKRIERHLSVEDKINILISLKKQNRFEKLQIFGLLLKS